MAFARENDQQPVRLFCQDESRLGLHLPSRCRLTGFGIKPRQIVEPHYDYYWIYGAVEPKTGASFFLEMPRLDTDCFEVFLAELARAYPESLNLVVLDQAPAHRAKRLVVPGNVVLVPLPAYSPELNPVERLWQDLKRQIDGRSASVRSSLWALREHVAELIGGYTDEAVASLTGYRYLVDVANAL